MNPNLQTLAAAWRVGTDNEPIAIDLMRNSILLQTATVAKATHGSKHRFRFFDELPTAAFRDIGQGITPQRLDHNTATVDLKELTFKLYEDYRAIDEYPGGKDGWLRDNYDAAINALAQGAIKATYYGNKTEGIAGSFKGLIQYAQDMDTIVKACNGTSGERTSIFGVRWDEKTGASIRINNTNLLDVRDLSPNNPVPIVLDTTYNKQMDVYQWLFASYFTLVMPSKSVAAITQLSGDKTITVDDMNALVNKISKIGGQKAIYTSELGMIKIAKLKHEKLNMFTETMDMNTYLAAWRGVPIYVDDNILETETY